MYVSQKSLYTEWKSRYTTPRHNKRFILVLSRFFLDPKHNSQELSTSSSINQPFTSCPSMVRAPLTRQYLVLHQTTCYRPTCPWAVWVCLVASSEEIPVALSSDDDAFCSTFHDNLAMLAVLVEASCTNTQRKLHNFKLYKLIFRQIIMGVIVISYQLIRFSFPANSTWQ